MKILGLSAYYHDSAAAIISGNEILAAVQEERFSRIKNDAAFPVQSIKYCIDFAGTMLNDLDAIVFYDKPFLKFERLLETYYVNAPKGFFSFIKAMPVWLKEKIFLRKIINAELKKIDPTFDRKKVKLLFTEHHLAHAASAFFASSFPEAAILTIDGVGEWATASISMGKDNNITMLKEMHFPDSVGLLYSAFTYFLGFKVNSGEYKLMGLAPYGNIDATETNAFIDIIENKLVKIFDNGSIKINQEYFNYTTGLTMVSNDLWEKIFGIKVRKPEDPITQPYCNLALAIQYITEKIVLSIAAHTKTITGADNICLAGGVALNCVANGKLQQKQLFKNIFIQPAAGDAGGAIGAALAANHIYFGEKRMQSATASDQMKNAFLGPEFSELDVMQMTRKYNAVFKKFDLEKDRNQLIIKFLESGKVIGLFNGRLEFGPRALGNRSIIADAANAEMQKKINLKIKFRESFRPFAGITTEEDVNEYFDFNGISPYMLLVHSIRKLLLLDLPANYNDLSPEEKLNVPRSTFPAITHVDGSCRIQTCSRNENAAMWHLLNEYKASTGKSILINTSFNVRGEPIVCNPDEAYTGFMNTGMDILIINNFIFTKEEQPEWKGASVVEKFSKTD